MRDCNVQVMPSVMSYRPFYGPFTAEGMAPQVGGAGNVGYVLCCNDHGRSIELYHKGRPEVICTTEFIILLGHENKRHVQLIK